jgi:hypothetical protein
MERVEASKGKEARRSKRSSRMEILDETREQSGGQGRCGGFYILSSCQSHACIRQGSMVSRIIHRTIRQTRTTSHSCLSDPLCSLMRMRRDMTPHTRHLKRTSLHAIAMIGPRLPLPRPFRPSTLTRLSQFSPRAMRTQSSVALRQKMVDRGRSWPI